MGLKVYQIQRNGNATETRFIKSTITKQKLIAVQDDINKTIWIFSGPNINSETKRLGSYAIDEIIGKVNYHVHNVDINEWDEKQSYLFELHRNPNTKPLDKPVEDKSIKVKQIEKIKKSTSKNFSKSKSIPSSETKDNKSSNKIDQIKSDISTLTDDVEEVNRNMAKVGFAPQPRSRKSKTAQKQQSKKSNKSKMKTIPSTKKALIPQPPQFDSTTTTNDQFTLAGDVSAGPMIDEFQIAYYEQSGGTNFILIQELNKNISNSQYITIQDLINSINDLSKRNATQLTAQKVLTKQLDILIKTLFRN